MASISDRFQQIGATLEQRLAQLDARERMALVVLAVFLSAVLLVLFLWLPHKAALKEEQRLTGLKDTIQWMQSNAVQLSTESGNLLTPSEKVQRIAQQMGLSVQSQVQQDQIELVTTHQNYAVLANFITELTRQGVSIVSMQMQNVDGQIQLRATVR